MTNILTKIKSYDLFRINTQTKGKSTIIVHSDSDDDFVVKEQKVQEDDKKKFRDLNDDLNKPGGDQSNEEHGALVKKILESKEQLEYGSEINRQKEVILLTIKFKF